MNNVITDIKFAIAKKEFDDQEGLVLLGTGGNLDEWIDGVTGILYSEKIAQTDSAKALWAGIYKLTTTGGRTDLLLLFNDPCGLDIGRMAMWRLRFGDASWWSDYVVNYAKQHK